MGIGSKVRRMFGRHERLVAEAWRAGFVDLDYLYQHVRDWVPTPQRILEIGCGEGAGTERLSAAYPHASILAVDIAPNLGRLYAGPTERVAFQQVAVTDLIGGHAGSFDLILMCDVLHHIPTQLREEIIATTGLLLAPGGSFIFKEWARTVTPIHWIAYAADRWLTGDKVQFLTEREAVGLLTKTTHHFSLRRRATIRPWRNNFALLMEPA